MLKSIKTRLMLPLLFGGLSVAGLLNAFDGSPQLFSNDPALKQLTEQLDKYADEFKHEKVYLHIDRKFFKPGDDIWFKAYVRDAKTLLTSENSGLVYVELIAPNGNVEKKLTLHVKNGGAAGDFKLDEEAKGGRYKIKAYTQWQKNTETAYEADLTVQNVVLPNLNMELDFEHEAYGAGDEVVARLDLNSLENKPLNDHEFEYIVQLNGEEISKATATTADIGRAYVKFNLPSKLETNDGLLNIMLRYKGQTESISRSIPIVLGNIDLQFFPESGDYIAGQYSKIAFKALNEFGQAADVEGHIVDERGKIIKIFKTYHKGMGSVQFTPEKDKKYIAKITKPVKIKQSYELPQVKNAGMNFRVLKQNRYITNVEVYSTQPKKASLVAQHEGQMLYTKKLELQAGKNFISIPTKDFPLGLTNLSLLNEKMDAVAERLIFVNPHKQLNVKVSTDKEKYLPREQVNMEIQVTDERGKPVSGNFSVAVTDDKLLTFADDKQAHLLSYILLESDLKGKIDEPNFYFDDEKDPKRAKPNVSRQKALDNLLLTQGWTRFTWEEITAETKPTIKFAAEKADLFTVAGKVTGNEYNAITGKYEYNKPIPNARVTIVDLGISTRTDSSGKFVIQDDNFVLERSMTLCVQKRGRQTVFRQLTDYNLNMTVNMSSYSYEYLSGTIVDAETNLPLYYTSVCPAKFNPNYDSTNWKKGAKRYDSNHNTFAGKTAYNKYLIYNNYYTNTLGAFTVALYNYNFSSYNYLLLGGGAWNQKKGKVEYYECKVLDRLKDGDKLLDESDAYYDGFTEDSKMATGQQSEYKLRRMKTLFKEDEMAWRESALLIMAYPEGENMATNELKDRFDAYSVGYWNPSMAKFDNKAFKQYKEDAIARAKEQAKLNKGNNNAFGDIDVDMDEIILDAVVVTADIEFSSSGQTLGAADVQNMSTRSISSMQVTTAGVNQRDGARALNSRGSRGAKSKKGRTSSDRTATLSDNTRDLERSAAIEAEQKVILAEERARKKEEESTRKRASEESAKKEAEAKAKLRQEVGTKLEEEVVSREDEKVDSREDNQPVEVTEEDAEMNEVFDKLLPEEEEIESELELEPPMKPEPVPPASNSSTYVYRYENHRTTSGMDYYARIMAERLPILTGVDYSGTKSQDERFQRSQTAILEHVYENLKAPKGKEDQEGFAVIRVNISTTGTATYSVLQNSEADFGDAARAAFDSLPNFIPSKTNGHESGVSYDVPVFFSSKRSKEDLVHNLEAKERPFLWMSPYHKQNATRYYKAREFYTPVYKSKEPIQVREDFRETIYWNPNVKVDESGKAKLSFYNSDAITQFRTTIEGFGAKGQLGRTEHKYYTQMPFEMLTKVPHEVLTGDKVRIPLTLTNNTDGVVSGELIVRAPENFNKIQLPAKKISLAAKQSITEYLEYEVKNMTTAGTFTIGFKTGALSDITTTEIRTKSRGFPIHEVFAGDQLKQEYKITIQEAISPSISAKVNVYNSVMDEVAKGMEKMIRMPHGCFEQTSSYTYPSLLALDFLRETGTSNPKIESHARKVIDACYKRLSGFQCKEGGFEWWGRSPAHEVISAYALIEFTDMAEVWPVNKAQLIDKNVEWLLSRRDGNGGWKKDSRTTGTWRFNNEATRSAYIVWTFCEAGYGDKIEKEIKFAHKEVVKTEDAYAMALMANALYAYGETAKASELLEEIVKMKKEDGSYPSLGTAFYSGGASQNIETTSLVALALIKSGKHKGTLDEAIRYIQNAKTYYGYGSTQGTILALKALVEYAKKTKKNTEDGTLELLVNNKVVRSVDYKANQKEIVVEDFGQYLQDGDYTIEVRYVDTKKALPFDVEVTYNTRVPVSSKECSVGLTTKLSKQNINMGETVRLTATVANVTKTDQPMTMMMVGIPGGLSLQPWQLKELQEKEVFDYYELFDGYAVFHYQALGEGESKTVNLDLKADIPGTYEAPASSAFLYYTNEYKVWSQPDVVTIN
ncbi:MAG: MG2 domain-containing protein [Saprospiraceae bacterium]|nr:MG2 domain-containing protein [Saprospiraceae bacterium]